MDRASKEKRVEELLEGFFKPWAEMMVLGVSMLGLDGSKSVEGLDEMEELQNTMDVFAMSAREELEELRVELGEDAVKTIAKRVLQKVTTDLNRVPFDPEDDE